METEKKWIAVAGRLEMRRFLYWVAIANALFILTVCISAFVTFLGMKLGFPFLVVRAIAILVFGALLFIGGRALKKRFDSKRQDLKIEIDQERIVFSMKGTQVLETSLTDEFEFLNGPTTEMGLGFQTTDGKIRIGCLHQTMAWKEGTQHPFQFELEPSDFIRLVGELNLEDSVERRT